MKLSIKNMVCPRCILAVQDLLEKMEVFGAEVSLGKIVISDKFHFDKAGLSRKLHDLGFELLDDKDSQTVEKIRRLIIELVYSDNREFSGKLSVYLSTRLNRDYSLLSATFSQTRGITIEQFYIRQKIERVKELLSYGEENLNEIADRLAYSSPSHLSRQFKSITGMTPSEFRKHRDNRRSFIDNI